MRGGCLAVLTLLSVTPAWGPIPVAVAAEQKAPAAQKGIPSGPPASLVQRKPGRIEAKPIPAELLAPVAQFPAELQAPSAADWLTFPRQLTFPDARFAVLRQGSVEANIVAGPADLRASLEPTVARDQDALTRASVPLPPRRPAILTSAVQQEPAGRPLDNMPPDAAGNSPSQPALTVRPISSGRRVSAGQAPAEIEALILRHAQRYEVPASLVRHMAWKESKFDPKQRNGRYWGLMQIRVDTARGLGFRGEPADLLDADTNMTYAVAYLANAYRVAGGNERRAERLYVNGYYYEAKRKRMLGALIKTASADE